MARRNRDDRPTMIHCDRCGEDYSSTYKRCPFCEEMDYEARQARYDDEDQYENGWYEGEDGEDFSEEEAPVRRGGSRLSGGRAPRRGGGYGGGPSLPGIIARVVSVALIIAAAIIVITIIMPLVSKGHAEPGSSLPPESEPPVTESQTPGPEDTTPPAESVQPSAQPSPEIPEGQTATGFTLNYTEFSFSDRYPDPVTLRATFTPAGTTGAITWTSSDPDVASVDANGRVSHGSVRGRATISASMPGAADQTCTVLNQVTSGTSSSGGGTSGGGSASTGTLSLNHTDFTFSAPDNPSVQMRVNGTSSTPSWSIGNTAVATISADGVVRPAGSGTTTITCTVDGQTLTCIVRCSF